LFRYKTNRGRVVYERPKHEFTVKDLERIWRKMPKTPLGAPERTESDRKLVELVISIVLELSSNPDVLYLTALLGPLAFMIDTTISYCSLPEETKSGFGGAGATRDF